MGSIEIGKIIGTVLVSVLLLFGINEVSSIVMTPTVLEKTAYTIEQPSDDEDEEEAEEATEEEEKTEEATEEEEKTEEAEEAEEAEEKASEEAVEEKTEDASAATVEKGTVLGTLLASADVAAGKKLYKKCSPCHTTEEDGKNKVGPNLYGVLAQEKGASGKYKYSKALTEKGGTWTYAELDEFLKKPKKFIKGTKMAFTGIKKDKDRANMILFLRSLGKESVALPTAE